MKIEVYSDGSGTTANTDGGYGWVMIIDGIKHSEGSGHVSNATNNDMELEGAIQGLKAVYDYVYPTPNDRMTPFPNITLISDSQIILGWADGSYRFKQENKMEKYVQLQFLMKSLEAKTQWVRGHSGNEHNERCDKLANNARKGISTNSVDKSLALGDTRIGIKKAGVVCLWHGNTLKVLDLENNIIENYNRDIHGKRGSQIEIREEKSR